MAKYTDIGGQSVLEGVMMRSPGDALMTIAVRKEDGQIVTKTQEVKDAAKKNKFYSLPIVRGVVRFVSMLVIGYQTISISAKLYGVEEEEPTKFEKWLAEKLGKSTETLVMAFALAMAVLLAVGLFILLPSIAAQLLKKVIASKLLVNLLEGFVRLAIFLLYMMAISLMKEIKRVFMYHGAEHKTIACFEAGEELTPQNARKYRRQHPRCGTSFLLIVMSISILLSIFVWDLNLLTRVLSRLLLLPLVAGVSYEALIWLGKHDNLFARIVRAPGMWLQNLTTKEPDDSMLEVAIVAFHGATRGRYERKEAPQAQMEPEEQKNDALAGQTGSSAQA